MSRQIHHPFLATTKPLAETSRPGDELRPVLLRVKGLKKAFDGQVVFGGIDLELHRGDVILLRGENGSGKTSLINILTGHLEPDAGTISYMADTTPRTYRFPRPWWRELNPLDHFTPEFVAQEGIGRTWQDIRLFGSATLRDNIAVAVPRQPGENPVLAVFALGVVRKSEKRIHADTDAILARLGLAGREESSADRISLGQAKRVAIARAVAAGASILFLDEPLSGLDSEGAANVLALIDLLVRDHTMTFIIVEHVFNQPQLRQIITADWQLANGKLTISASVTNDTPPSGTFQIPVSTAVECGRRRDATSRRPRWLSLLVSGDTEIVDEPLPHGAILSRLRNRNTFQTPPVPVLTIRDLIVRRGLRTVVGLDDNNYPRGFNLTLYQGEVAILQAPNGWGKTTLLASVLGLIPSKGIINLGGESLCGLTTSQRVKKGIRALPSNARTFPTLRVRDFFSLAGKTVPGENGVMMARRLCSSLSGGERQSLAWHGLMAGHGPRECLLLDEPFAGLDGPNVKEFANDLCRASWRTVLILVPRSAEL